MLLLQGYRITMKMLLLFWSFLSKRVIQLALTSSCALSTTVNCGIMSVPSSVWNRLLISIIVCPLFTLNKIRIIINHDAAWESVVHRRRSIIFCDNATETHLINVLVRSGLGVTCVTLATFSALNNHIFSTSTYVQY